MYDGVLTQKKKVLILKELTDIGEAIKWNIYYYQAKQYY